MQLCPLTTYGVGTNVEKRWTGTSLLSITAAVSFANLKSRSHDCRQPITTSRIAHDQPQGWFVFELKGGASTIPVERVCVTAGCCSRCLPVLWCRSPPPHLCCPGLDNTWTGTSAGPAGDRHAGDSHAGDRHVFRTAGKQREDVVSRRNLCGLDHGQVVDPAEPGSHRRPQSSCAEDHPVAESGPQVLQVTCCHQSLHLSPSAGVLQDQTKTADVNQREVPKWRQLRAAGAAKEAGTILRAKERWRPPAQKNNIIIHISLQIKSSNTDSYFRSMYVKDFTPPPPAPPQWSIREAAAMTSQYNSGGQGLGLGTTICPPGKDGLVYDWLKSGCLLV